MLEPDASKGARPVLRGGGAGDSTSLPDPGRRQGVIMCTIETIQTELIYSRPAGRASASGIVPPERFATLDAEKNRLWPAQRDGGMEMCHPDYPSSERLYRWDRAA